MSTTVTSKGQVTIPRRVRDQLGIQPGNAVNFELAADGRVILLKVDDGRLPAGSKPCADVPAPASAPTRSWR